MVEWDGDRGGGVGYVISGSKKQVWFKCKASLQLFEPNWEKKGFDYGGWFTWSKFRQGSIRVQARLDHIYGPRDDFSFSGNMWSIEVLIVITGSDHLSVMTSILVGHVEESKPLSLFNINVSYLESTDFQALVHSVWNLVPHLGGGRWILWWEATIRHTMKFITRWGHMIA